jgi:PPOX class probable F420-dependent enzyme
VTTTSSGAFAFPREVAALLDAPNPAVVGTTGEGGTPHLSVVWIERQGNQLAFFCTADSVKVRNLRVREQITVVVIDPDREFEPGAACYARISGVATMHPLTNSDLPDRLARRYMGVDEFPHRGDYVMVLIIPTRLGGIGPHTGAENHGWGP